MTSNVAKSYKGTLYGKSQNSGFKFFRELDDILEEKINAVCRDFTVFKYDSLKESIINDVQRLCKFHGFQKYSVNIDEMSVIIPRITVSIYNIYDGTGERFEILVKRVY